MSDVRQGLKLAKYLIRAQEIDILYFWKNQIGTQKAYGEKASGFQYWYLLSTW